MRIVFFILICIANLQIGNCCIADANGLERQYRIHSTRESDIYEHLPTLRELARECSSAIEIGVRDIVSTWGILQGLSETQEKTRSYLGIDLAFPPASKLSLAKRLSQGNEIQFEFWPANDMEIDIPETDLLFIDSLHTYCHMTYELEKFSHKVTKIICMHDTSDPWGNADDSSYNGDYSEYPPYIDRTKKGLWPAVVDFLSRHPEWTLQERKTNNHGFTILRRASS